MLAKKLQAAAKAVEPVFIEDTFAVHLYTGNGSTQTITNGIDLAGKGGLVWVKSRSVATSNHALFDSARGANNILSSNTTSANTAAGGNSFNANGFNITNWLGFENANGATYASWTFRKAPKFFDVVTYTGNGSLQRTLTHSLGIAPGLVVVKATSTTGNWLVKHKDLAFASTLALNSANAQSSGFQTIEDLTATTFDVYNYIVNLGSANADGVSYVAYLFARDTSASGLIQCGSYTGNGSATGPTVTLDWEPQWLMIKRATGGAGNWNIFDSIRGMASGGNDAYLEANTSDAEALEDFVSPNATGFEITSTSSEVNASGNTYIFMAIRS